MKIRTRTVWPQSQGSFHQNTRLIYLLLLEISVQGRGSSGYLVHFLPSPISQRFSPLFLSFIVLYFTFKFIIHFKLIFVWGVRFRLRFIFAMISSCSSTICWQGCLSSVKLLLYFWQKISWAYLCESLTGFSVFSMCQSLCQYLITIATQCLKSK